MSPEGAPRRVFSARAVLAIIMVGLVSAVALMLLSIYGPEMRKGDNGAAHALSRSAVGFAGLVKLLKADQRAVIVSRAELNSEQRRGLLVLTPAVGMDGKTVTNTRFGGPRLIVLPKWQVAPDPRHKGWVMLAGMEPPAGLAALLDGLGAKGEMNRANGRTRPILRWEDGALMAQTGDIESFQTFTGSSWRPIITDGSGHMLLGQLGEKPIYVLSDPDLLNTHGLKQLQNARVGVALLDELRGRGPIYLDTTLHGFKRSRNVFRLALEPPFVGATLCLVFAAVLAGLFAAARFGPPARVERAIAYGKQALTDNTAGLIRLARRENRMGDRYAVYTRGEVGRAVGAPHDLDEDALEAFLDRLSRLASLTPFTELRQEARRAQTVPDLMVAARKIYDWRLEMTRERR